MPFDINFASDKDNTFLLFIFTNIIYQTLSFLHNSKGVLPFLSLIYIFGFYCNRNGIDQTIPY